MKSSHNDTFSKRFGMSDDIDTINQTSEALGGVGEVHVEAFGESSAEIEDNANSISERSEYNNLIFKVPFTESGVEATSKLSKKGFSNSGGILSQNIRVYFIDQFRAILRPDFPNKIHI